MLFKGNLLNLSMHKYSSNIVEKLLERNEDYINTIFIFECLDTQKLAGIYLFFNILIRCYKT